MTLTSSSISANELNAEEIKQAVMEQLRHYFRPEFLNRIDETMVFHSFVQKILLILRRFSCSPFSSVWLKELQLSISDQVLVSLVNAGYDPVLALGL